MSQPIEIGMLCIYLGPGEGKRARHKVIESVKTHVITWSEYKVGDIATEGWSWMGPRDLFCKHFRPIVPEEL